MIVIGSEKSDTKEDQLRPSLDKRGDVETSNCDYMSDVFREQLSELEYSRMLQDSDEKD